MSRLTRVRQQINGAKSLPKGVKFYLFGSILIDAPKSDIDLLCVYDATRTQPKDVYSLLEPLIVELRDLVGTSIHPVILTEAEEQEVCFIESERCVPVELL